MKEAYRITEEAGFKGFFYTPEKEAGKTLIVVIGDDGNDFMDKAAARWITDSAGGNALCVALRSSKKEDPGISCFPIETIHSAVNWLKARKTGGIGILGMSMQASLALTAASLIPDISLTVAFTPSDFVPWGFLHGTIGKSKNAEYPSGHSTFTWQGRELPFQPSCLEKEEYWNMFLADKKKYREMHSISLFNYSEQVHPVTEEVRINVENIKGTLVLIGAEDDSMWNAAKYIGRIEQRLKDKNSSCRLHCLVYKYGTHLLVPRTLLTKGLPLIGSLVPALFRSGRSHRKECRESQITLEKDLKKIISNW